MAVWDNDKHLLAEFKSALERNRKDSVVNLDEKFIPKFEFFVQTYQEIIKQIGNRIHPHKWSYYRVGLVKKGTADYTCGIYKFQAEKNTLIIIPARTINTSVNWTPDAEGFVVVFNTDFFLQNHFPYKHIENKRILQPTIKPYIRLTDHQAEEIETIFHTLIKEKERDHPHKNEYLALKLIELIIVIERIHAEVENMDKDSNSLETVRKFAELVEENFMKERTVSFYASQLHIHPNYLNSLIKTHTGLTAKDSILNRLLLETKFLLHTTDLSIKEISNMMGFDDPNYFAVFFKRSEKLSPASYRAAFV